MYICCKHALRGNRKHCPYCGDANPHWEGVTKRKYYPFEGRRARERDRRVAVRTSEFRRPRKGEYFLSGARPYAYLAPNDLSKSYRIMHIIDKPAEN